MQIFKNLLKVQLQNTRSTSSTRCITASTKAHILLSYNKNAPHSFAANSASIGDVKTIPKTQSAHIIGLAGTLVFAAFCQRLRSEKLLVLRFI